MILVDTGGFAAVGIGVYTGHAEQEEGRSALYTPNHLFSYKMHRNIHNMAHSSEVTNLGKP